MAWSPFGTRPLLEQMQTYCQLDYQEQTSVKFESKYVTLFQGHAIENAISKMSTIFAESVWFYLCMYDQAATS